MIANILFLLVGFALGRTWPTVKPILLRWLKVAKAWYDENKNRGGNG